MKSTRALGAIAAGSLLFAACSGGSATDSSAESTAVGDATSAVTEVAAGEPATEAPAGETTSDAATGTDATGNDAAAVEAAPAALQFSAPLVGGGELDASTLAGKPTVFWFWAPT
jgi:hypothetical protein